MRKALLMSVLVLSLGGCTAWPQHGHSGAAELRPIMDNDTLEHDRLMVSQDELHMLRAMGARQYFPAALEVANVQWNRTARAVQGGFPTAARTDLDFLENLLFLLKSDFLPKQDMTAEQETEVSP